MDVDGLTNTTMFVHHL